MGRKKKIAIVGAGIAGLTTATLLIEKGFDITIYESSEEIGGLAKSKRTKEGYPTEHSFRVYHDFYYCLFEIFSQLKDNDHCVLDNLVSAAQYYHTKDNRGVFIRGSKKFTPEIYRIDRLIQFFNFLLFSRKLKLSDIYEMTKLDFLYHLSEERIIKNVGDKSVSQLLNMDEKNQAFKDTIMSLMATAAGARDHSAAEFVFELLSLLKPSGNLYMMNGPTSECVFEPWKEHLLKKGVKIVFNAKVTDFAIENNKIINIYLEDGKKITADDYVLATSVLQTKQFFQGILSPWFSQQQQNIFYCEWSEGVQFYLSDLPNLESKKYMFKPGITLLHLDSPWRVASIIQGGDFWPNVDLPKGCKYVYSVTFSNVEAKGSKVHKPFLECTEEEIKEELLHQCEFPDKKLIIDWHLSETLKLVKDAEYKKIIKTLPPHYAHYRQDKNWFLSFTPLFTPLPGNYSVAPNAKTKIDNLFLSGQYLNTTLYTPTMEKACESGYLTAKAICTKHKMKDKVKLPFENFNQRANKTTRKIDIYLSKLLKTKNSASKNKKEKLHYPGKLLKKANNIVNKLNSIKESHNLGNLILEYALYSPELDVAFIKPLILAKKWKKESNDITQALMVAVKENLLQLKWHLYCPESHVILFQQENLKAIPEKAHCSSCNINYKVNLDTDVEVTFTPETWLREIHKPLHLKKADQKYFLSASSIMKLKI